MKLVSWNPIETAPQNTKKMFVVRAFNITHGSVRNYTSDPVVTWVENGEFTRWSQKFAPTHWCELPDFEETGEE